MSESNNKSNNMTLNEILSALIKTKNGSAFIKERFEDIKKLFLGEIDEIEFYERKLEYQENNDINTPVNNFFEFIKSLKNVPEFEVEYEDYSYWANLYEEIKIPDYKLPDISDIFEMSEVELRKLNTARQGKFVKTIAFSRILLAEDKNERQEKAIILDHIANGGKYEFKSCGSSGLVLQTGDQIVKLGLGRRKFEVPYHPRIMMPYFRKKYSDDSCLEIFNYGNVESADITDEKLLEIYKELEADGILWGDASKRNLAVLLKDNDVPDFVSSQDFNLFGFLKDDKFPTDKHKVLKAGDIVICDLDMLYVKGDPDYQTGDIDDIIDCYIIEREMEDLEDEYR